MEPNVGDRLKLAFAVSIAAAGAVLAAGAALSLGGVVAIVDLAPGSEVRAERLLARTPPDPVAAARATQAALAQAPSTASAWARLAYLEQTADGRLKPAGVQAMERSYLVAPLDPDITAWRVRFLFERWTDLPPSLREKATVELRTLSHYRADRARDLAQSIQNPAGRLAASLTYRMGRDDADRETRRKIAPGR